jgi:phosphoglycerate dehydrogenase-like enzyme
MKLYTNIEELNAYQEHRLKGLNELGVEMTDNLEDNIDIMLLSRWNEDYLKVNPKAIFVPYTGMNRFPLDEFKNRNIYYSNSHAKAHLVAERALSLALSVMGKIKLYDIQLQKDHYWSTRAKWGSEFWMSLYEKRVAIIGMGHIGRELINFLNPFKVTINNLKRDEEKALADNYYDFDELVLQSDLIFLTCPLTSETEHMVNVNNIHLFQGKVIVNVARGAVIEEKALYTGLEQKILYGAGIDVWYQYPTEGYGKPSRFDMDFNNLVMSPHASCHAKAFEHAYYDDIFNQIEEYLRGHYESRFQTNRS